MIIIHTNKCWSISFSLIKKTWLNLLVSINKQSIRQVLYNIDWACMQGDKFLGCNRTFGNQTRKDVAAMLDEYTINTNENSFVNPHSRWLPKHQVQPTYSVLVYRQPKQSTCTSFWLLFGFSKWGWRKEQEFESYSRPLKKFSFAALYIYREPSHRHFITSFLCGLASQMQKLFSLAQGPWFITVDNSLKNNHFKPWILSQWKKLLHLRGQAT